MLTREQAAGCRATIKSNPKPDRRWRESILVAALDSIDFLESHLATLTQERDALKRIIDDTLREVPVGNVNAHIPENLPMDMEYYVQETVKQDFEIERLEKERDALREEFIQAYMQTEHALAPSSPAAGGG